MKKRMIGFKEYWVHIDYCLNDGEYGGIDFKLYGSDINDICLNSSDIDFARGILWKHYVKEQFKEISDKVLIAAIKQCGGTPEDFKKRKDMERFLVHTFAWDIYNDKNYDESDRKDVELFLKDICGRMTCELYGKYIDESYNASFEPLVGKIKFGIKAPRTWFCMQIKPYLFPLSSMTEEQRRELEDMGWSFDNFEIINIVEDTDIFGQYVSHSDCFKLVDWLNKNHFDYRGLIKAKLAIDATGLGIY